MKYVLKTGKRSPMAARLPGYFRFYSTAVFLLYLLCSYSFQGYAGQATYDWYAQNIWVAQEPYCCPQREDLCCSSQESFCDNSAGCFFLRGDLLYWRPHITGLELDFGTTYISETTTDGVQIVKAHELDLDPHFKWNVGYRAAAGYKMACSRWEVAALWTHFQDSASRNRDEDSTTVNKGQCWIRFDQVDAVFVYNAGRCSCFDLKPFFGVRAAEIHEKLHTRLVTDITLSATSSATETRTYHDHQLLRAIGSVMGLNANWEAGCGIGFYGTTAVSILYGRYDVHFKDQDIFTAPFSKQIYSKNTRKLHGFDCNVDLAFGIRWSSCLCNSLRMCMKLGYEHHQYFNISHLSANRGDLCLDGGVFSILIDF